MSSISSCATEGPTCKTRCSAQKSSRDGIDKLAGSIACYLISVRAQILLQGRRVKTAPTRGLHRARE
jgi:hypothetical protein